MSTGRRDRGRTTHLRQIGAVLLLAFSALSLTCVPAKAQFLPKDFFASLPDPGGTANVQADTLAYDQRADIISAEGRVIMSYQGYTIACDDLRYEQASGALVCEGNVEATDPLRTTYTADRVDVTGGMKEAFVRSLTMTTKDGATVTARDASYSEELETVLTEASYSPCGLCIDKKGNRIGWKVKAAKLVQDAGTKTIYFEQPSLEILGIPVAWLPWLSMPDPTSPQSTGFLLPTINYKTEYGGRLSVPYFVHFGEDIEILLSPTLLTRQGFLMAAEYQQTFDYGWFSIKGSGLYQLDPGAFSGVGNREWRGAIQTAGEFEPLQDWTVGWTYTKFSDPAYFDDYDYSTADWDVNEVYATHLSRDFYADVRLQEFLRLGQFPSEFWADHAQDQQAATLPNARGNGYFDLGEYGRVRASGSLLGVHRDEDDVQFYDGVGYVLGYEGIKTHATGELSWQRQFIAPGGVVATPYLGLRADVAEYSSGDNFTLGEPDDQFLFEATPIAAVDIRWPLIASNGPDAHLLEPIAQLVYRGSDTSLVGTTNDNAQSFVLDDTNLFSYDRFSGSDRQETGLRTNVGARYLANFADGSWFEFVAGQSFQLAGVNAFDQSEPVNPGVGSGLEQDASDIVLAARGSPFDGVTLGAKVRVDTEDPSVSGAVIGGNVANGPYAVGGDYAYLPADADRGRDEQHEVTVRASAPLPIDYWRANSSFSWDIDANQWLEARGELLYDDGYFLAGGYAQANGPTHENPDSVTWGVKMFLKAPGDQKYGFDY